VFFELVPLIVGCLGVYMIWCILKHDDGDDWLMLFILSRR
jgi:hypothetical protein